VFLIDFGIARAQDFDGDLVSNLEGKEGYEAPEIQTGAHYDARADIYSLALSLLRFWICLPTEQTMSYSVKDWQYALEQHRKASPQLVEILLKCIDPDPDQRCQSASDLTRAFEALPERFENQSSSDWLRQHWGKNYAAEEQRVTQLFSTTVPEGMDRTQALAPINDVASLDIPLPSAGREISLIRDNGTPALQPLLVSQSLPPRGREVTLIDSVSREFSGRFTTPIAQVPWRSLNSFRLPLVLIIAASFIGVAISKSLFDRALQKQLGRIMLDITPNTQLQIFLDGQERLSHKTPMFLTEIAPGSHSLIVQRQGYQEIETSILIEPNGLTNVVLKLDRMETAQAYVTFVLDVEKCTLSYDEKSLEVFSGEPIALPANRMLDLKLTADKSDAQRSLSVKLQEDETFKLRFSLL
jgi:hypothetical protein